MAAAKVLVSSRASNLLATLQEDDRKLQEHALRKLYTVIDTQWAEASELVAHIEGLAEDDTFPARELAAAVASKCYYHLEALDDALRLALGAGAFFDVNARTEYVETIISRCIDEYTKSRLEAAAGGQGGVDARLEEVVNRMFSRCWADGSYRSALGVALEARRLDVVEETLRRAVSSGSRVPASSVRTTFTGAGILSPTSSTAPGGAHAPTPGVDNTTDFLAYGYDLACSSSIVPSRAFRQAVLGVLVKLHLEAPDTVQGGQGAAWGVAAGGHSRDYSGLCRCYQALNDAPAVASVLVSLLQRGCAEAGSASASGAGAGSAAASSGGSEGNERQGWANHPAVLLALQIAFDVVDAESQDFAVTLYKSLPPPSSSAAAGASAAAGGEGMAVDEAAAAAAGAAAGGSSSSSSPSFEAALARLKSVLDGSIPCALTLDFLSSSNKCDHVLLNVLKKAVDPKNSTLHSAIVSSHALMNAGTTHSGWLSSNMDWLRRAANWARFSAAASVGVVHRGHLANAMKVLEAYLPRAGAPTESPYAEGGALYALGIIHAGRGASAAAGIHARPGAVVGDEGASPAAGGGAGAGAGAGGGAAGGDGGVVGYLFNALETTMDETVQHGACLGLGLAALGTGSDTYYSSIRRVLLEDKAVAGEAAGLAIGMLLLGHGATWKSDNTGEVAASEMLGHAHATQHEKIVRGIGIGLALMCYGKEDEADGLIRQLGEDKDAILRYGGMFAIGMAYAGTANNAALKRLLHVAVSDVSDDVRRAAVINIGFVLARQPAEIPTVVGHLAESYNPHVRYGAAMALGIACAGTGLPEAIALLEPLASDGTDYVRQGAYIALGLILQCEGEAHLPRAKAIREKLLASVQARGETSMAKMGAIVALGLLDAGGRNAVAGMISRGGFQKATSVVGLAVFTQYWYWFPLLHTVSLALSPSALLGLTGDLQLPSGLGAFSPTCACPPSWFAYTEPMSEEKKDKKEVAVTVELSTAAKARARAKAKEGDKKEKDAMEVDAGASAAAGAGAGAAGSNAAAGAGGPASSTSSSAPADAAMEVDSGKDKKEEGKDKDKKEEKEKKAKEPGSYRLVNPCRVSPGQAKFVVLPDATSGQRFVPLLRDVSRATGVVVLQDLRPAEPVPEAPGDGAATPAAEPAAAGAASPAASASAAPASTQPDIVLRSIRAPSTGAAEEKEAPAPKAFEWTVGDYYPEGGAGAGAGAAGGAQ